MRTRVVAGAHPFIGGCGDDETYQAGHAPAQLPAHMLYRRDPQSKIHYFFSGGKTEPSQNMEKNIYRKRFTNKLTN
jgi:hypothetical protein